MEAWLSVSQRLTSRHPHSVCREQSFQHRTFKGFGFSAQCCLFFLSSSSFFTLSWWTRDLSGHANHPKIVYCNISKGVTTRYEALFLCLCEEDMKRCFYMFFLYRFFTSSPWITKRYKQEKKTNISSGQRGRKSEERKRCNRKRTERKKKVK